MARLLFTFLRAESAYRSKNYYTPIRAKRKKKDRKHFKKQRKIKSKSLTFHPGILVALSLKKHNI
jgi:hypothetical protein